MKRLVLAATLMAACSSAPAAAIVVAGNTTAGATFNRALTGRPPTGLSAVGTAVRYVVTPFTVTQSGNYDFNNTSVHDSFLGVHAGLFNPLNALQNALAYDDDAGPGSDSQILALGLLSGTDYFAVSSGFANTDFGAFTLTITGPGDVVLGSTGSVPEPASWAMLIAGFGLTGAAMRRRRQVAATASM